MAESFGTATRTQSISVEIAEQVIGRKGHEVHRTRGVNIADARQGDVFAYASEVHFALSLTPFLPNHHSDSYFHAREYFTRVTLAHATSLLFIRDALTSLGDFSCVTAELARYDSLNFGRFNQKRFVCTSLPCVCF